MPLPERELSMPRLGFVTVRLMEVGALAAIAGAVQELWAAFQSSAQFSPFGTDGLAPADVPFFRRIVTLAFYSGIFRAPVNLLIGAVLLAVAVGVVVAVRPVSNLRILRWELLVVWALTALVTLTLVVVNALALFGDSPYSSSDPSVVTSNPGPGIVEQAIGGLSVPVATSLLLAAVLLWWLRLPRDPDDPDEPALARRRRHRPEPAAEPDALVLDGVEQIEPVERLHPRAGGAGDGATASGYDDYFRKF
ncbi:hypothetical protein [Nostocoides sp. HKS02]|uniref:hypothetical protein n=1 Tax=Nostocoides sp. HKS02 TaxID=1813880 RepID=UPI0012B4FD47|nr:hypothetical protein [Tetrasphaera sp. HKS02]QGN56861.1 hypothetical protein GKE56_01945 [Tetrasphaera sp. HKS02]